MRRSGCSTLNLSGLRRLGDLCLIEGGETDLCLMKVVVVVAAGSGCGAACRWSLERRHFGGWKEADQLALHVGYEVDQLDGHAHID